MKFITLNNKKIVKPYDGVLMKNYIDILEKQDVLDRAAQLSDLKFKILNVIHYLNNQ